MSKFLECPEIVVLSRPCHRVILHERWIRSIWVTAERVREETHLRARSSAFSFSVGLVVPVVLHGI